MFYKPINRPQFARSDFFYCDGRAFIITMAQALLHEDSWSCLYIEQYLNWLDRILADDAANWSEINPHAVRLLAETTPSH